MLINLVLQWKKMLKSLNKKELINHHLKTEENLQKKMHKSQRQNSKKLPHVISKNLKKRCFLKRIPFLPLLL